MKLSAALSILTDLRLAVQIALPPTIRAILKSPSLIFQPSAVSRLFMDKLWLVVGPAADEGGSEVKQNLITPNAYGVVLDIGAGHGHAVKYLDKSRVTKYIALEPNTLMHANLRTVANAEGFNESNGTLLILSCGAEDTASILSSIPADQSVDTLVAILTLCTIPSPENTLSSIVEKILKPGGQLLFYEHVLSRRSDVAWWQRFWAPAWSLFFDGCRMDRATDIWLDEMIDERDGGSAWSEKSIWGKEGEPEESLFGHSVGRMVKRP